MKVIVIGSGIAGLSAATELLKYGIDVLILESNDRVGGRITKADNMSVPIDLGASWIHRINGNPLADIAKELNLKLDLTSNPNLTGENSFELYDCDGTKIETSIEQKARDKFSHLTDKGLEILKTHNTDLSVEQMFHLAQKEASTVDSPLETRIVNWLKSGIEGWENTTLSKLSAKNHFSETDQDLFSGPDGFVVSGFFNVVEHLGKKLGDRILLNQPVQKVIYTDKEVCVKTKTDMFVADYCISTLPLGVMKLGTVSFYPALPQPKQTAIERLGFGVMNKIVLEYKECFWNPKTEGIGFASGDDGDFNFIVNLYPLLKKPILMCFVTGDFARKLELLSDEKIIKKVTKVLNKIYGSDHPTQPRAKVPLPVHSAITRWHCNPNARGSYSFMKVGSSLEDVHQLAEPVGNLLFAGEATFVYPGYVHGAFLSGVREARRIVKTAFYKEPPKPRNLVASVQLSAKL